VGSDHTNRHQRATVVDDDDDANFGVEKLRGLGNTRGQILDFPIEMAGHQ